MTENQLEGWDLFFIDENNRCEIQRRDEFVSFVSDEEAAGWVLFQAATGSQRHLDAVKKMLQIS